MLVQILRQRSLATVAHGDKQRAIRTLDHAAAEMPAALVARIHLEQQLYIAQRRPVRRQHPRGQRRPCTAAILWLGIGQQHRTAVGKVTRQGHIQQSALPAVGDLGHACHCDARSVRFYMPQRPGPLGDQKPALWQEVKGPGRIQILHLRGKGDRPCRSHLCLSLWHP